MRRHNNVDDTIRAHSDRQETKIYIKTSSRYTYSMYMAERKASLRYCSTADHKRCKRRGIILGWVFREKSRSETTAKMSLIEILASMFSDSITLFITDTCCVLLRANSTVYFQQSQQTYMTC